MRAYRTSMQQIRLSPGLLFATAAVAAAGFVALTRAVAAGKTARWDRRAKRAVHAMREPAAATRALTAASHSTTPLGKWWGHVPAALFAARKLARDERHAAALTIAGTSLAAAVLPLVLDRVTSRRSPPPERHEPEKQSYPSGHALQSSAMALATGYVLHREQLAAPGWLASLGPLSLATGLARLILDRHWTSDVIAGYCAGIALGATSTGLYELSRSHA
jgi:undecaprenyl-diphosphatase